MKYSFDSRVRYSEVGEDRKLTLNSLINYFQDSSTFHSEAAGVGMEYLEKEGKVWVLSSWQIVVECYPKLFEKIKISTWPYHFRRFFGSRNFTMEDEAGNRLAYANSLWTLMDIKKGCPADLDEKQIQAYPLEPKLDMEYAPRKIQVPAQYITYPSFSVKAHHLDTNHHVNNGQYILMAMEYVPAGFSVTQMRAEYKKQAVQEDIIIPKVQETEHIYTIMLTDTTGDIYAAVELK